MSNSTTTDKKPSKSQRFKSFFRSPASSAYDRVLARTYEDSQKDNNVQATAGQAEDGDEISNKSILGAPGTGLTHEEKARALVRQRDAESPSGHFMLGHYRPLAATQGNEEYLTAKGALEGVKEATTRR